MSIAQQALPALAQQRWKSRQDGSMYREAGATEKERLVGGNCFLGLSCETMEYTGAVLTKKNHYSGLKQKLTEN